MNTHMAAAHVAAKAARDANAGVAAAAHKQASDNSVAHAATQKAQQDAVDAVSESAAQARAAAVHALYLVSTASSGEAGSPTGVSQRCEKKTTRSPGLSVPAGTSVAPPSADVLSLRRGILPAATHLAKGTTTVVARFAPPEAPAEIWCALVAVVCFRSSWLCCSEVACSASAVDVA